MSLLKALIFVISAARRASLAFVIVAEAESATPLRSVPETVQVPGTTGANVVTVAFHQQLL